MIGIVHVYLHYKGNEYKLMWWYVSRNLRYVLEMSSGLEKMEWFDEPVDNFYFSMDNSELSIDTKFSTLGIKDGGIINVSVVKKSSGNLTKGAR